MSRVGWVPRREQGWDGREGAPGACAGGRGWRRRREPYGSLKRTFVPRGVPSPRPVLTRCGTIGTSLQH
jgi:hypothetical protein